MTTNRAFEIRSGYSHTLGANYDGEGVNFAIFSAHAERVELAFTIRAGSMKSLVWSYRNIPTKYGTAMSRSCSPARCMGTAFTVLMTRKMVIVLTPTSCLLTLMPVSWWAIFSGTMRISRINYFMTIKI